MATLTEHDRARAAQRYTLKFRNDPDFFVRNILGTHLYPKQVEILEAVRSHRRVAVSGCNSSGKDFCSGRIIPWWIYSWWDTAAVVIIGPSYRQVAEIVWRETRSATQMARCDLGGVVQKSPKWVFDDDRRWVLGFATSDEFNIQGFHNPHLLVILTEAHNIDQTQIEAVKRLNPYRLLLTGNPLASSGEFHAAFHERAHMYHTIEIGAKDTPNLIEGREVIPGLITQEIVDERALEWGKESALYIASVLGKWPENLTDAVVPRAKLLAARERTIAFPEDEHGEEIRPPKTISCDVARFGDDATVVYERQGPRCRLLMKEWGLTTMETAGKLLAICQDDEEVDTLIVDATGVGGGVVDRLREMDELPGRVNLLDFNGGQSAYRSDRYANLVTEAWMELAKAFTENQIDLVVEDGEDQITAHGALISQLSSRRYTVQSDRRMKLESKEDYKRRNFGSPDEADALAQTELVGALGAVGLRWL